MEVGCSFCIMHVKFGIKRTITKVTARFTLPCYHTIKMIIMKEDVTLL